MIYVALLRGINVGGKNRVEMQKLKLLFEKLGFTNVRTYINSGNVIFETIDSKEESITKVIEDEITKVFGFEVKTIIRSGKNIQKISDELPNIWDNDANYKTDVLFLWPEVNSPEVLKQINIRAEFETLKYIDGALIWHIERKHTGKSGLMKIVGTPLYKQMTIRNVNTVRKLQSLMIQGV